MILTHMRWRLFLALAAALVAFAFQSSSAHAVELEKDYGNFEETQDFYVCDAKVWNTYVVSCFNNNGDVFYTADWEPDGRRVATHWKLEDGSRRGLCISTLGPAWIPTQGWVGRRVACNKNLPEGKRVLIRGGACDADVADCETLGGYSDWTNWDSTTV